MNQRSFRHSELPQPGNVQNIAAPLHVARDKAQQGTHIGVDGGRVGLGAWLAKRDCADQHTAAGIHQRAARVAVARVLAALNLTSADHGAVDSPIPCPIAAGAFNGGNLDLEKDVTWHGALSCRGAPDVHLLATGQCGVFSGPERASRLNVPSSDLDERTATEVGARGGEARVSDIAAGADRLRELNDGNVRSSLGRAPVAWVDDERRSADLDTAAGGPEGTRADEGAAGVGLHNTVSGSDDGVLVKERPAAEVSPAPARERDDVRKLPGPGRSAAHDIFSRSFDSTDRRRRRRSSSDGWDEGDAQNEKRRNHGDDVGKGQRVLLKM